MDLKEILLETRRTLYFNKRKINTELSEEELKNQILSMLNGAMVKHYRDDSLAERRKLNEDYIVKNAVKIKSVFNRYLLNLDNKERNAIESGVLVDPKLVKMINTEKVGITFMNIERNIKISSFALKKSSNSYIIATREKDLSLTERRYLVACEIVNILIQDILPRTYQYNKNRVIDFRTLSGGSTRYEELINNIVMDYYLGEMNMRTLLDNDKKWYKEKDVTTRLTSIYKMPKELVKRRIDASRLNGKIKEIESR